MIQRFKAAIKALHGYYTGFAINCFDIRTDAKVRSIVVLANDKKKKTVIESPYMIIYTKK